MQTKLQEVLGVKKKLEYRDATPLKIYTDVFFFSITEIKEHDSVISNAAGNSQIFQHLPCYIAMDIFCKQ